MTQHTISTTKTARYFQLGEFTDKTENLIIACHGYAQLAKYFLKWFEGIPTEKTVIIAPEGLHRFYWEGFSGRVVASWMTKEDRLDDINDYVNFIDNVVKKTNIDSHVKITALGFSQGCATISRWVAHTNYKIEHIILWAGVYPEDIPVESVELKTNNPVQVLFGNQDTFYNLENLEKLKKHLSKIGLKYEFTLFKGEHKIYTEPLTNQLKKLNII